MLTLIKQEFHFFQQHWHLIEAMQSSSYINWSQRKLCFPFFSLYIWYFSSFITSWIIDAFHFLIFIGNIASLTLKTITTTLPWKLHCPLLWTESTRVTISNYMDFSLLHFVLFFPPALLSSQKLHIINVYNLVILDICV